MSAVISNNPAEDIAPVSPFGAIDYGHTSEELEKLAAQFDSITEITDRASYDAAQKAVTALTRARTAIEKRRKQLKAESLEFGRLVDSTGKELMAVVAPQEERIKALIDEVKAQKAAEKAERERIEQERVDKIQAKIEALQTLPREHERSNSDEVLRVRGVVESSIITEDEYAEFTADAIAIKAEVIEALNELYAGALHDERIAKEEAEAQAKREAEQKAEAERLAKEREALAKQQAEMAAQQAAIDAERKEIEEAKRAEVERAESERKAKEQSEREAEADKQRAAQLEALKPDAEKLAAYAESLMAVAEPALSTEQARAHMEQIQSRLSEIQALANLIGQAA